MLKIFRKKVLLNSGIRVMIKDTSYILQVFKSSRRSEPLYKNTTYNTTPGTGWIKMDFYMKILLGLNFSLSVYHY